MPNVVNLNPDRRIGPGDNNEESKTVCSDNRHLGTRINLDERRRRQANHRKPAARSACRGRAVLPSVPAVSARVPGTKVKARSASHNGIKLDWIKEKLIYLTTNLSSRIWEAHHPNTSPEGASR